MDQQQVLNQQQIQPIQPAIQGNNDAANLARQIQANTNVTMKTEVVKLPDFFGDPAKDAKQKSLLLQYLNQFWAENTFFSPRLKIFCFPTQKR